ncbi:MAG: hypothetical protein RLY40_1209 [Pseudomonadota bacterium]|jgi:hypothetical protein
MCPNQEQEQKINGLEPILKAQNKNNSLIIGVSVGAEHFEDIKLSSLVNAINILNEKVTHCIIAIGDTLQRHNYTLDGKTNEKEAYAMSMKAGDAWIERNTPILNKLKISYQTIRWNEWLNDSRFPNAFAEISTMFDKDSDFKNAIECSVKSFSVRFRKRHEELGFDPEAINPEILEQNCRAYLLEECAIIMQLWPTNNNNHCEYLLYPGKMTKALAYAYDKVVQKKDLFKWNKYTIKQKNRNSTGNILVNFKEKLELTKPDNIQERYFFLSVLAGCTSIITSQPDLSREERLDMLSIYTNRAAFFNSSTNGIFEFPSQEVNFTKKNI